MTAQEMFEELEFKKTLCINLHDKKSLQIRYEKVAYGFAKIRISFYYDVFYANLFYLDDKENCFKNVGGCAVDKELLKAINKQCQELGWLDE